MIEEQKYNVFCTYRCDYSITFDQKNLNRRRTTYATYTYLFHQQCIYIIRYAVLLSFLIHPSLFMSIKIHFNFDFN